MSDITTSIDPIQEYTGTIPNKATQDRIEFAQNVEPYLKYVDDTFVGEFNGVQTQLNAFASEANSLKSEVNNLRDASETAGDLAQVYSGESQTWAIESQGYASDAANSVASIDDTAYALTQIGINLSSVQDGDLILAHNDPITSVSFNSENELIIEY